jgi:hypothetical protein
LFDAFGNDVQRIAVDNGHALQKERL